MDNFMQNIQIFRCKRHFLEKHNFANWRKEEIICYDSTKEMDSVIIKTYVIS